MSLDAFDQPFVNLPRRPPGLSAEEVVKGLDNQVTVVANEGLSDVSVSHREVPDEECLFNSSGYLGDSPENVVLGVHEGEGPDDVVWKCNCSIGKAIFKLMTQVLKVGDVAVFDELEVTATC